MGAPNSRAASRVGRAGSLLSDHPHARARSRRPHQRPGAGALDAHGDEVAGLRGAGEVDEAVLAGAAVPGESLVAGRWSLVTVLDRR